MQGKLHVSEIVLAILLGLVLLVLAANLWMTIDTPPWHHDESAWTHSAYYYNLITRRDYANKDWSHFAFYDNPPIGKYIFGAALHFSRGKKIESNGGVMEWHRKYLERSCIPPLLAHRTMNELSEPQRQQLLDHCRLLLLQCPQSTSTFLNGDDLRVGRFTSLCFALMAAAVLLAVCWNVTGQVLGGLTASIILLHNRVTIPCFQQALLDSICGFFAIACLGVLILLVNAMEGQRKLNQRIVILSLFEGLLISLAVGTKFVALCLPISFIIVLLYDVVCSARQSGTNGLASKVLLVASIFLIVSTTALTFFILTSPFLLKAPLHNTMTMLSYRGMIMAVQSACEEAAITSLDDRLRYLGRYGVLLGFNLHSAPLRCALLILLIGTGVVSLIRRWRSEFDAGKLGPHAVIVIWIMFTFAVNGTAVHLVQMRYFVPFAICISVLAAFGAAAIIESAKKWRSRQTLLFRHLMGTIVQPCRKTADYLELRARRCHRQDATALITAIEQKTTMTSCH